MMHQSSEFNSSKKKAINQKNKYVKKIKLQEIKNAVIINVWKKNMKQELENIFEYSKEFKYIGFDTEFPGTIY